MASPAWPLWTILIPTTGYRAAKFQRLAADLCEQAWRYRGAVTIEALWNNGERPLNRVRQDLIEHATATYVSFIDDDDEVPANFVDKILPLLDGVDFIGFKVALDQDGQQFPPTIISLKYGEWSQDHHAYYRDITYVNPFKRAIALEHADFTRGREHMGEDRDWVDQLRGHLKTEHFIDEFMYYYHYSPGDSIQNGALPLPPPAGVFARPEVENTSVFSWHPASTEWS